MTAAATSPATVDVAEAPAEPAKVETPAPQPAKAEAPPEPAKAEAPATEPAKADAAKTESAAPAPEPVKPEAPAPEAAAPEPAKAEAAPEPAKAEAPVEDLPDQSTAIQVHGLGSFGAITSFKQSLERVDGIRSVTLGLGPTGEFVYTATHAPAIDLSNAIRSIQGAGVEIERDNGTLRVRVSKTA